MSFCNFPHQPTWLLKFPCPSTPSPTIRAPLFSISLDIQAFGLAPSLLPSLSEYVDCSKVILYFIVNTHLWVRKYHVILLSLGYLSQDILSMKNATEERKEGLWEPQGPWTLEEKLQKWLAWIMGTQSWTINQRACTELDLAFLHICDYFCKKKNVHLNSKDSYASYNDNEFNTSLRLPVSITVFALLKTQNLEILLKSKLNFSCEFL